MLLFNPLPKVNLVHLVNSSTARFGFAGGEVVVTTLRARGDGAAAGLGLAGTVTGVVPLIARGAAGAVGGAFGLPPAPTVVHAPEPAGGAGEEGAGALLARSA